MRTVSRILAASLLLCLAGALCNAGQRTFERTYISTDSRVYTAGDVMRLSAFCLDMSRPDTLRLSSLSSIAYVELHNASGRAVTAKVALVHGRGAAQIELPRTLPTGNYAIVAYTAQNLNESPVDWSQHNCGTVSIYNVFSSERVENGVDVVSAERYDELRSAAVSSAGGGTGPVSVTAASGSIRPGGVLPVRISVPEGFSGTSVSVSVRLVDGIIPPEATSPAEYLSVAKPAGEIVFEDRRTPEYDGEVMTGHVSGIDSRSISSLRGREVFLSSPGDGNDTYCGRIDSLGRVKFFTNNIYGHRDMVCQTDYDHRGESTIFHIEMEDPFVGQAGRIGTLPISGCISDDLSARGTAMQIGRRFDGEDLTELLPVRENRLFGEEIVTYRLDDYTRFPTMAETFTEIIGQVRLRNSSEGKMIQVRLRGTAKQLYYGEDASLVMVDGVPVFDHSKIMEYDPYLVRTIDICPYTYWISGHRYDGIVNFVTFAANLPSMTFGDDVRIIDFEGPSIPSSYTCPGVAAAAASGRYPDYRRTLWWHPAITLAPDSPCEFNVTAPSYCGRFEIRVEGFTAEGLPISSSTFIEVK